MRARPAAARRTERTIGLQELAPKSEFCPHGPPPGHSWGIVFFWQPCMTKKPMNGIRCKVTPPQIARRYGVSPDKILTRRAHRRLHVPQDIIVIALCAVIAGAQDWQEIETFGCKRRAWLQQFLKLPHGIPSHETFE